MQLLTLTTDWIKDDYYAGAIKGTLYSKCENIKIVTLSNSVKSYRISEAAFIVRNSFKNFPDGSVHIIAIGTDPIPEADFLLALIEGHYFICSDNGFLSLLGDVKIQKIIKIDLARLNNTIATFPTLSVFAEVASMIVNGKKLEEIGTETTSFKKQIPLRATLENNTITGAVIYIDSYGNAITNISKDLFNRIGKERLFEIYVQSKHYKIIKLNKHYSETPPGDLLALFNSVELLEIAICHGSANELLNLNTDSTIRVEFKR